MKISRIAPLFLFIFLSMSAFSQKKGKPVVIADPGEMYSTFDFSEEEKTEIAKQVSPEELESIMKYHTEDTWPSGINDLEERTGNPDKMKQYKALQVAKFGDKRVLKITAKKNKHLSFDMVGDHDFYFIIGEGGVK